MTSRLNPYALQALRNTIMSTLAGLQPQVDDIFTRALQRKGKVTHTASVRLITCWLVSVTHILTGSRTRVEKELQTPNSHVDDRTRAILVFRAPYQLGRITLRDKQANKKGINYPTLVLFSQDLSAYWQLYLMFVTETGAKYAIQYDYDLNEFFRSIGVSIDRSYEMRHMYLNNIGLQYDFDLTIMQYTSTLVRHDLTTQRQHYTVWRKFYHSLDPKPGFETVPLRPTTVDMTGVYDTMCYSFRSPRITPLQAGLFAKIPPIKSNFVENASRTARSKKRLTRQVQRNSSHYRIVGIDTSADCTAICFWRHKTDFHVLYRTIDGRRIDNDPHAESRWPYTTSGDIKFLKELVTEIRSFEPQYVVVEAPIDNGPRGKVINQAQNNETARMVKHLQRHFQNIHQLKNGCAKAAYLSTRATTPNVIAQYPPLLRHFQAQTGSLLNVVPSQNKQHPGHDILDAYLLCYLQAECAAYAPRHAPVM